MVVRFDSAHCLARLDGFVVQDYAVVGEAEACASRHDECGLEVWLLRRNQEARRSRTRRLRGLSRRFGFLEVQVYVM